MATGYFILFMTFDVATAVGFVLGLMTHVFIIAVNVIDWRQGRSMTTSDQVIISITISKIALQLFIQINIGLSYFIKRYPIIIFLLLEFTFISVIFSSIWLSTLHSVVLYVKISTLHNGVFLWLKKIITKHTLSLIAAIVVVSAAYAIVYIPIIYFSVCWNSTQPYSSSNCEAHKTVIALYYIGNIFPFLICLLSSLLLITSLGCHISRMRHSRNSTSSLDVYYRTIKYTIVSLLTCALYIIFNISEIDFIFIDFLWMLCTTLNSMYIVYVTAALRKRFSGLLLLVNNCLVRRREPDSREQAETVTR